MGRRTIAMIEINEVLYCWVKHMYKKRIARALGMSINTVRKIIRQAEALGLQQGETRLDRVDGIAELIKQSVKHKGKKTAQISISIYHEKIAQWSSEKDMTVMQMKRLLEEQGDSVSYSSLARYVSKHFSKKCVSTVVLHTEPGKEAQVDFGSAGMLYDLQTQRKRKAYAFVMTLSYSRNRYVRFVFHQDEQTWIDCHIRSFEFFGGVPQTIILDNLKAGVIKPNIYDPTINRAYAECERYYGFVVDPALVRTPEHKGKVERNMPIVRQQILAGRNHSDIQAANQYAEHWCRYEISQRVTRTTGQTPWERFINDEKPVLLALPEKPYECPDWQSAKVHKDHHVVVGGSFYSVATAYIGKTVWVRVGRKDVQIFSNDELIKVHPRASCKGTWVTDKQDYPESARKFLDLDKAGAIDKAHALGPHVSTFIEPLLSPFSRRQQRKILAVFRLSEIYDAKRLDAACQRALCFGNDQIECLKNILKKGLETQEVSSNHTVPTQGAYIREPNEFITYH